MGTKHHLSSARTARTPTAILANAARGHNAARGVIVIQEWWGLQDQIKGMCDRFALAGLRLRLGA